MAIQDLVEDRWFSVVQENVGSYHLRHLKFEIDMSLLDFRTDNFLANVEEKLKILSAMTSQKDKVVYTIEVINYSDDDNFIIKFVELINPCIFVVRRLCSRDATLVAITDISKLFTEMRFKQIAIGLSGLLSTEIEYFLNAKLGIVKLLCLGSQLYPNIQVHISELAHAQGCNTILAINDIELSSLSDLDKYSKKYNRSNAIVLMKAILQMGTLVEVSRNIDPSFMRNHCLRLGHPFTHAQVIFY